MRSMKFLGVSLNLGTGALPRIGAVPYSARDRPSHERWGAAQHLAILSKFLVRADNVAQEPGLKGGKGLKIQVLYPPVADISQQVGILRKECHMFTLVRLILWKVQFLHEPFFVAKMAAHLFPPLFQHGIDLGLEIVRWSNHIPWQGHHDAEAFGNLIEESGQLAMLFVEVGDVQ